MVLVLYAMFLLPDNRDRHRWAGHIVHAIDLLYQRRKRATNLSCSEIAREYFVFFIPFSTYIETRNENKMFFLLLDVMMIMYTSSCGKETMENRSASERSDACVAGA